MFRMNLVKKNANGEYFVEHNPEFDKMCNKVTNFLYTFSVSIAVVSLIVCSVLVKG